MKQIYLITAIASSILLSQVSEACCRIDIPTPAQVVTAVTQAPAAVVTTVTQAVDHNATEAVNVLSGGAVGRERHDKDEANARNARNAERDAAISDLNKQKDALTFEQGKSMGIKSVKDKNVITSKQHVVDIDTTLSTLNSIRGDFEDVTVTTETLQMAVGRLQLAVGKNVDISSATETVYRQMKEQKYSRKDLMGVAAVGKYLSNLGDPQLIGLALNDLALEAKNTQTTTAKIRISKNFSNLKQSLEKQKIAGEAELTAQQKELTQLDLEIASRAQQISLLENRIKEITAQKE